MAAVEAGDDGLRGLPADPPAAPGPCDLDAHLGHVRVALPRPLGDGGSEAGHDPLALGYHHRVHPVEPGGHLVGRAGAGLEGRDALGDPLVVDGGDGRGVGGCGGSGGHGAYGPSSAAGTTAMPSSRR